MTHYLIRVGGVCVSQGLSLGGDRVTRDEYFSTPSACCHYVGVFPSEQEGLVP